MAEFGDWNVNDNKMTPMLQRVLSRVSFSTIAVESSVLGESVVGGLFSQLKHNRIQTRSIHKPAGRIQTS